MWKRFKGSDVAIGSLAVLLGAMTHLGTRAAEPAEAKVTCEDLVKNGSQCTGGAYCNSEIELEGKCYAECSGGGRLFCDDLNPPL